MANTNFMTAGTEIDGCIEKKNQCLTKIANVLAEACVERGKSGKVTNNMPADIYKLIQSLPSEDQVQILCLALTSVSGSINGGTAKQSKPKKSTHADYFSNRGL